MIDDPKNPENHYGLDRHQETRDIAMIQQGVNNESCPDRGSHKPKHGSYVPHLAELLPKQRQGTGHNEQQVAAKGNRLVIKEKTQP